MSIMGLKKTKQISIALGLSVSLFAFPASANPASQFTGEFERPYGFAYGEESQAYDARTRDRRNNRVIIDGRMVVGDDLSNLSVGGVYGYNFRGYGSAYSEESFFSESVTTSGSNSTAIGNQLNVITNGNNNSVVINSTQTNSGDQTVILNGELDLND
jgi:holdfast attachment protein HfaA